MRLNKGDAAQERRASTFLPNLKPRQISSNGMSHQRDWIVRIWRVLSFRGLRSAVSAFTSSAALR